MRVQAGGCTDVSRLGGKHLFDFLERRIIISDKVWSFFGPFRWRSSVLFHFSLAAMQWWTMFDLIILFAAAKFCINLFLHILNILFNLLYSCKGCFIQIVQINPLNVFSICFLSQQQLWTMFVVCFAQIICS